MKFSVDSKPFLAAVKTAANSIERRNTIPILSFVHIAADKSGKVTVRGTNLDIEIATSVNADVEKVGTVCVSAELLRNILGKLPDKATVIFEEQTAKTSVSIRSGRSRFNLHTLPPSDFPDLEAKPSNVDFVLPYADLETVFGKPEFAISTEETRYYLNGIYFHVHAKTKSDNVLRGVATDGHRLASADIPKPEGADGMPGVIVPRYTISNLAKSFAGAKEVAISVSESKIVFTAGETQIVSKLIDGSFPDYQRVVPSGNDKVLTVEADTLRDAVDRVSIIRSERGPAVKLGLASNQIKLSTTNPDAGSAEEELEADYQFDPMEIGFNSRYLGDTLEKFDGETVDIKLADPGSPTLFLPRGKDNFFCVLMPMRV